ncbi:MAG: hypothetical protein ACHQF2_08505 [Flavobacteriales bacterium]
MKPIYTLISNTFAKTSCTVLFSMVFISLFGQEIQEKEIPAEKQPSFAITVGVNSLVSANCMGLQYNPYAGVRIGKRTEVLAGAAFNKSEKRLTGFNGRITCAVLLPENSFSGKASLYNFVMVERHTNQRFSPKWTGIEEWVARTGEYNAFDFSSIHFTGWQTVVGFGTGRDFIHGISANFNLGFSCYWMKQTNFQHVPVYYQPKGIALHLSMGLKWSIETLNSNKAGNSSARVIRKNI